MLVRLLIKIYGPDWKTSLNGDLAFLATAGTFVTGYVVITPQTPRWLVLFSGVVTFVAAASRAIVGRLQSDAPKLP